MSRLNSCKQCGGLPRLDRFKLPSSDWVYLVEGSAQGCDHAEIGDTPEASFFENDKADRTNREPLP